MNYQDYSNYTHYSGNPISNIISLALFVLLIVSYWNIFVKAGKRGWAAIIPFYCSYTLYSIAKRRKLYWGYLACMIIEWISCIYLFYIIFSTIFAAFGAYDPNRSYDNTMLLTALQDILTPVFTSIGICLVTALAALIIHIIMLVGLTREFDLGAGWVIGLIFLPHIFYAIIAFTDNIQYVDRFYEVNQVDQSGYSTATAALDPMQFQAQTNPFAGQNSDTTYPYAQPNYSNQPNYGSQTNYGNQPGYGPQTNYGSQPGYDSRPNYGSPQGGENELPPSDNLSDIG